ncbi:MAG: hypothetical protein H6707_02445 [Deltaproteobacteria bacterium]|nr:hypothetical protein [Deltaproteobacteria bacterium]
MQRTRWSVGLAAIGAIASAASLSGCGPTISDAVAPEASAKGERPSARIWQDNRWPRDADGKTRVPVCWIGVDPVALTNGQLPTATLEQRMGHVAEKWQARVEQQFAGATEKNGESWLIFDWRGRCDALAYDAQGSEAMIRIEPHTRYVTNGLANSRVGPSRVAVTMRLPLRIVSSWAVEALRHRAERYLLPCLREKLDAVLAPALARGDLAPTCRDGLSWALWYSYSKELSYTVASPETIWRLVGARLTDLVTDRGVRSEALWERNTDQEIYDWSTCPDLFISRPQLDECLLAAEQRVLRKEERDAIDARTAEQLSRMLGRAEHDTVLHEFGHGLGFLHELPADGSCTRDGDDSSWPGQVVSFGPFDDASILFNCNKDQSRETISTWDARAVNYYYGRTPGCPLEVTLSKAEIAAGCRCPNARGAATVAPAPGEQCAIPAEWRR